MVAFKHLIPVKLEVCKLGIQTVVDIGIINQFSNV